MHAVEPRVPPAAAAPGQVIGETRPHLQLDEPLRADGDLVDRRDGVPRDPVGRSPAVEYALGRNRDHRATPHRLPQKDRDAEAEQDEAAQATKNCLRRPGAASGRSPDSPRSIQAQAAAKPAASHATYATPPTMRAAERFIAFSMCVLTLLKL